jgi:ribonuclease BN (tRNA processing enzyme)
VTVEIGDRILVIDAGTGIRSLGAALRHDRRQMFLLLTHPHYDHILGFPFFAPLYEPGARIHCIDYENAGRTFTVEQMFDGVHVPMRLAQVAAACERTHGLDFLAGSGFDVRAIPLNHPGGALGYRIAHAGRSFVHITDNELAAPDPRTTSFATFVEFCRGADLLAHDAQWIDDDLPAHRGWGHSTVAQACDLAAAAGAGRLVLFHHDPDRTDDALDALQEQARDRLAPHGIDCVAAYEGLRIDLGALAPVQTSTARGGSTASHGSSSG